MFQDSLPNWKHLRAEVKSRWSHLTHSDLDGVAARRHRLVMLLENHYGLATHRAEREVDQLVNDFKFRLKSAA